MTWIIKLVMFICVVPTVIIMFSLGFSGNPGKRKMIFGVRDNPKFHEDGAAEKFAAIVRSCRRDALIITVIVCAVSVILLCLPASGLMMLAWVLLVYAMFLISVPFAAGNRQLKSLKKELGITRSGNVYVDLSSTNTVHALKLPWVLLPNAIALAGTVFAILTDFGIIKITENLACEKYSLTMLSLSFMFVGILFIPIACMMDNTRNTVISKDSNVNANYNRAKKKGWADLTIAMSWTNALFLVSYTILCMFVYNDTSVLIGILAYMVILMTIVVIGARTQKAIEKRYERDTDLELLDDDDQWILGMFYYNPQDTRLNVEKRFGYGGTVNIAHPAGKVIIVITVILLVGSIAYLIWLVATGQMDALEPRLNTFVK